MNKFYRKGEDLIFPILENEGLSLYRFSKGDKYDEYLQLIKEKYGYIDMVVNDCDFIDDHGKLLSLSKEGLLYDVVHSETFQLPNFSSDDSRYCCSESKLFFYPKLYTMLSTVFCFGQDLPIDIRPLVDYFIQKEEVDERKMRVNLTQRLVSAKMSISERTELVENIKEDIDQLTNCIERYFLWSYPISNGEIRVGANYPLDDQQIYNFYSVGKTNAMAINTLNQNNQKKNVKTIYK